MCQKKYGEIFKVGQQLDRHVPPCVVALYAAETCVLASVRLQHVESDTAGSVAKLLPFIMVGSNRLHAVPCVAGQVCLELIKLLLTCCCLQIYTGNSMTLVSTTHHSTALHQAASDLRLLATYKVCVHLTHRWLPELASPP